MQEVLGVGITIIKYVISKIQNWLYISYAEPKYAVFYVILEKILRFDM
jgi:hypothetical protein